MTLLTGKMLTRLSFCNEKLLPHVILSTLTQLLFFCSSWINDADHPTIATLTKRIAAMTNLDMGTVEPLQVVNYGIGGQYDPHYDHTRVGIVCCQDYVLREGPNSWSVGMTTFSLLVCMCKVGGAGGILIMDICFTPK